MTDTKAGPVKARVLRGFLIYGQAVPAKVPDPKPKVKPKEGETAPMIDTIIEVPPSLWLDIKANNPRAVKRYVGDDPVNHVVRSPKELMTEEEERQAAKKVDKSSFGDAPD